MKSNTLYLSSLLKEIPIYRKVTDQLLKIFQSHSIQVKWLEGTKDIWARDYLPVKVADERYVSFAYEPWYLKGFEELRTNRFGLPIFNELSVTYSDINLDGGNVELSNKYALVTDRIYAENPNWSKEALEKELELLLERKLIVVRAYNKSDDMTGHIDGMMRFVDENTLIGNAVEENDTDLKNDVVRLQKDYGLNYKSLPYFDDPFNKDKRVPTDKRISAKGIYVNFLKLNEIILFPVFNEPTFEDYDNEAEKVMIEAFLKYKIVPIHINEIAKQGGLINCISWVS